MRKLLSYMLAVFAFAACEQAAIEEQSSIRDDAPETLTVGFECDDTRIQLNEAQKTVWTNGDLVSVFYRSDANQKWEFTGETGARIADLICVDEGVATEAMKRVVVVYPYNEGYYINTDTFNVQATLPAVQSYLKDSYGLNGNIMISQGEYNNISLKSVCGWLKLQLTGNGEKVKSITLKGNNGEQVAGELYINSADATAILSSDAGNADDGETGGAGGGLVFEDAILKEVVLDCGEGVALGKNATAFYIALPPQTFEQGFTVEIVDTDGYVMEQSTDKALTIERNTIKPMAAFEFINPNPPTQPTPASNQIWYTSSDGNIVEPNNTNVFGANIISNTYTYGMGVITFDGDVTTIGESAFYVRKSLTSVKIPDSVTSIGNNAFSGCYSLTSVKIPDSVTSIGNNAFWNCDSLTSVNIPDSVMTIGNNAFRFCESLTSVNIPDSVTTIGDAAFAGCTSLKEFKGKYATEDGRSLIVDNTIIAYANDSGTTYTIPDSVTTIGNYAFDDCDSLTSVNIPDSVTTIGNSAFYDCDSLTSVNIPDSVTSIGEWAFYHCYSLTSVTIGDSVTTIGNYAFCDCTSLTSVNIPDSVTTIGNYAFDDCDSLTSVNIPDSVTTIREYAFCSCNGLSSITIPDSVKTIGDAAFYDCRSLTSVNIPDSVTSIGEWAFGYCGSLTSVNIPDSVTSIGDYAFYSCSLTSVYCKAITPPVLGGIYVFYNNGSGRKIYVPMESVETYKSATNWSEYASAIVGYDF